MTTPQPEMPEPANAGQTVTRMSHRAIVEGIAHRLADPHGDRGELAALRRLNPDRPNAPAFWRLAVRFGLEEGGQEYLARWGLVVHGIALMAPHAHDRTKRLGAALCEAGVLEGRLNKLLAARGGQLRSLIPPLCRYLHAKGQAINWHTFAELIMSDSYDDERAESCRLDIARHYFTALSRRDARTTAA